MKEWLTDKEKRILFSALTREKEVCKKVDNESCREPYEETLVSVVKSLEQKFYYDKLFKEMEKQIREEAIRDFINENKNEIFGVSGDKEYIQYEGKLYKKVADKLHIRGEGKEFEIIKPKSADSGD